MSQFYQVYGVTQLFSLDQAFSKKNIVLSGDILNVFDGDNYFKRVAVNV